MNPINGPAGRSAASSRGQHPVRLLESRVTQRRGLGVRHAAAFAALVCGSSGAWAQTVSQATPENLPPLLQPQVREHAANSPTALSDPYPIQAAGWGPTAGQRYFIIRWAEDWSKLKAQSKALPLKAMPLIGDDVTLTLSSELRTRVDAYSDAALIRGNDFHQTEFRAIVGGDLRLGQHFRVYGELGTAQIRGQSDIYTPNFRGTAVPASYRNDLSVQQLFGEARTYVGDDLLVGVMAGRMEFTDGPRQIISISDGPNLHRTWNGVRLYAHHRKFRVGAFDFKVTRPGSGAFDETVNHDEQLKGANASIAVLNDKASGDLFVEPFLYRVTNIRDAAGSTAAPGRRDTWGARVWGNRGPVQWDWTAFRQTGVHDGRKVDAWAASFIQNMLVYNGNGVRVRAGGHVDLASGGNSYGTRGSIRSFNQLYASVGYLGQGLLLSQSNIVVVAPAVAIAPVQGLTINLDYAFLHRQNQNDAIYGGLMRPYAGTQNVRGSDVGTYARATASWSIISNLTLDLEAERLFAGDVLKKAGYPKGGTYGMTSLTFRY